MNQRLLDLATRRGALLAQSAEQRRAIARNAAPVAVLCAGGDGVLRGVDWVKRHPLAVAAALAVSVVARPRRAWRWGRRAFLLWRGWQALHNNPAKES